MEMETFCSSMRNEMTEWKAKTYDLMRKAEENSPAPDPKAKAAIDDMKSMIDRIQETIERLEKECPTHWDSERAEIERTMCGMRERWNETASASPDDFE